MRGFLVHLVLLASSTALSLVIGEVVVRAFYPQNIGPTHHTADEYRGTRLRPNATFILRGRTGEYNVTVTTNSQGWRSRELEDAPRIMVLGDSFTYGFGVAQDETYPARTEALLRQRGYPHQVVNMGVDGRGPDQYWADYRYGKGLVRPDLLIIGFFEGNDFIGSSPIVREEGGRSVLQKARSETAYGALRELLQGRTYDLLAQHSHLAVLTKNAVYVLTHRGEMAEAVRSRERFVNRAPEYTGSGVRPKDLQVTLRILGELVGEARADGVRPVVLVIPALHRHIYTSALIAALEGNGVDTVDLRVRFEGRVLEDLYHSIDDSHWNRTGHALAAEALVDHLVSNRLVERGAARSGSGP
jgi:hypothetical protein